jgi:hypothetical protein
MDKKLEMTKNYINSKRNPTKSKMTLRRLKRKRYVKKEDHTNMKEEYNPKIWKVSGKKNPTEITEIKSPLNQVKYQLKATPRQ